MTRSTSNAEGTLPDQSLSLAESAVEDRSFWQHGQPYLGLLLILAITLGSFWAALNSQWLLDLGRWGYLGVALINFFASATVVLPAPGLAVVFSMGSVFDPVVLGILSGIASGLGELSGYLAGATGRQLVDEKRLSPFLHHFATRYTALALFVLAIVPSPFFDVAGILAGAMRIRIVVFLSAVISGKIIKHVLVALMGAGLLPVIRIMFGG